MTLGDAVVDSPVAHFALFNSVGSMIRMELPGEPQALVCVGLRRYVL